MVYDNAEYMGVPWETIIKLYRQQLGDTCFPKLEDYYGNFMQFLGSNEQMFGEGAQRDHALLVAYTIFSELRESLRQRIDNVTQSGTALTEDDATAIRQTIIAERLDKIDKMPFAEGMDAVHEAAARALFQDVASNAMTLALEDLPLSDDERTQLESIAILSLTRNTFPVGKSGVVVAGFGSAEHFPSLKSVFVEARIAGRLKFKHDRADAITNTHGAAVIPFAQTDAVSLFVEGIDPSHRLRVERLGGEMVRQIVDGILASLEIENDDRAKAEDAWAKLGVQHLNAFVQQAQHERRKSYIEPLLDVIESLPKDELASLAEARVNITSLRRKVSMSMETVGGPIDVAVISRGDGLIWIKRKHYFHPDLNRHFLANYFRESQGG